jgi:hypothetical protein
MNKVRVPTSETAAKVQGYNPTSYDAGPTFFQGNENDVIPKYFPEHQTILKKYSEQPKTIKKLFGKEPAIVTDGKGNTWYEFDIPDKFKKGKGEIKAFGLAPIGAGLGVGASQLQEKKYGGWLDSYQDGGHIIQPGETFYGIANKYKLNKEDLINANPGLDIDFVAGFFDPLSAILVGGALFAAFFLLTDKPTLPVTTGGRFIYGFLFAFFTLLIRVYAAWPEGVIFATIIVNALSPIMDSMVARKSVSELITAEVE